MRSTAARRPADLRLPALRLSARRSPLITIAAVLALLALVVCAVAMHAAGSAHAHDGPSGGSAATMHAHHEGGPAAPLVTPLDRDAEVAPHGAHEVVQMACLLVLLTVALLLAPSATTAPARRWSASRRSRGIVRGALVPHRAPSLLELSISRT